MPGTPVFLDTNVFLYAAGRAHPHQAPCVAVLTAVAEGTLDATTSAEVLQEVLHVLIRRGLRDKALTLTASISALIPDLLPVRKDDLDLARRLLTNDPSLSVRDAVHAGTVLAHGLDRIVSLDTDFDRIQGVRRVEPRDTIEE